MDSRDEFKAARDAGLRKRHARRLERRWQTFDTWLEQYERTRAAALTTKENQS